MGWVWAGLVLVALLVVALVVVLARRGGAGRGPVGHERADDGSGGSGVSGGPARVRPGDPRADDDDRSAGAAAPRPGRREGERAEPTGAASGDGSGPTGELADPYGGRGERSYSNERLSPEAERDLAEFERADELFDEQDRRMMGGSADPLGGSGPGHGSGRGSGPTPDTRNGREPGSARPGE